MIKTTHATLVSVIAMLTLTWWFDGITDNHWEERKRLQDRITKLENDCSNIYPNRISYTVTVTTYNPTRQQCDSTPHITADGTRINPRKASSYRYIALSRNLLKRWGGPFDYGDFVVIEGAGIYSGVYQVKDTMNPRFTNRVDILRSSGSKHFKYTNVTLYRQDINLADNN